MSSQLLRAALLASVLATMPSCVKESSAHTETTQSAAHSHSSDLPTHAFTVWTAEHEWFVDHAAVVVGRDGTFNVHLARLATGDPIDNPKIDITRISPTGESSVVSIPKAVPGIWVGPVRFDNAGTWKLSVSFEDAGKARTIDGGTVEVYADEKTAIEKAPAEGEGIVFLKPAQWMVQLTTALAQKLELAESRTFPAQIKLPPEGDARIVAPVAGSILPPESGFPSLGSKVKAGQVLFLLRPPIAGTDLLAAHMSHHELEAHEIELATKLANARSGEVNARHQLKLKKAAKERLQALVESGGRSQRELDEASFELEVANSSLAAATEVLGFFDKALAELHEHPLHAEPILDAFPSLPIVSPIDGVLDTMSFSLGEHVEAGSLAARVVNTAKVRVEAMIPMRYARFGSEATHATVDVDGQQVQLERIHSSAALDANARVTATFDTDNAGGALRPGANVSARVFLPNAEARVSVPHEAVVDDRGVSVVFVQTGGELFERRVVQLGRRDSKFVEITSGVSQGERVVVSSAYVVRLASLSGALPDHHEH